MVKAFSRRVGLGQTVSRARASPGTSRPSTAARRRVSFAPAGRRRQVPIARPRSDRASERLQTDAEQSAFGRASPGCAAALEENVEPLLGLDRVHRLPEAVVGVSEKLASLDQARERLLDEVLAGLDRIEDVPSEHEEPTVDPYVRLGKLVDRGYYAGGIWIRA
jgi:hypothetical protein